jgi:hypothetical protein
MSVGLAMRDDWSGRASVSFNPMVSATNYSARRVAVARVQGKGMLRSAEKKTACGEGTICKKETLTITPHLSLTDFVIQTLWVCWTDANRTKMMSTDARKGGLSHVPSSQHSCLAVAHPSQSFRREPTGLSVVQRAKSPP